MAARQSPRPPGGVRVRRRDLPRVDVWVVRGIRVACPPLAALEAAVAVADGSLFLDRVLQRHVRFPALDSCFCRNMGRNGSTAAGRLVTAAADRADSAAERLLKQLLREAGITGWEMGVAFGPYTIDAAFPGAKVAIEVDGWAWHVDADRFRNEEGQRARSCGMGGAALHLARSDHPAGGVHRRDPGRADPVINVCRT